MNVPLHLRDALSAKQIVETAQLAGTAMLQRNSGVWPDRGRMERYVADLVVANGPWVVDVTDAASPDGLESAGFATPIREHMVG